VPSELSRYSRSRLRASDKDREQAVQLLRTHFAEGRLPAEDLEQRVERAYTAESRIELARLLSDLPAERVGRLALGRAAQRLYWGQRAALKLHAGTYVAVNGSLVGVWELTGQGLFWPGVVLAPMTALLGAHAAVSRWLRRRLRLPKRRG
jgi:hypothetical protein